MQQISYLAICALKFPEIVRAILKRRRLIGDEDIAVVQRIVFECIISHRRAKQPSPQLLLQRKKEVLIGIEVKRGQPPEVRKSPAVSDEVVGIVTVSRIDESIDIALFVGRLPLLEGEADVIEGNVFYG